MIGEMPEAYKEKDRIARKPHKCCECGGGIAVGQIYSYASGVWEGQGESYKTCKPCHSMRSLVCSWSWVDEYPPFGELIEWATETVKDDKTSKAMVEEWLQGQEKKKGLKDGKD